jgi:hypothetical protein
LPSRLRLVEGRGPILLLLLDSKEIKVLGYLDVIAKGASTPILLPLLVKKLLIYYFLALETLWANN